MKNLDENFLINSILLTSSFYLFFITLRDFFIKGYQNLSQNLAHFGFSLLILSILFNNIYSTEVITNLKVGQTFKSENLIIDFQSVDKKVWRMRKCVSKVCGGASPRVAVDNSMGRARCLGRGSCK